MLRHRVASKRSLVVLRSHLRTQQIALLSEARRGSVDVAEGDRGVDHCEGRRRKGTRESLN